jgi:tetratricopeptide (TPR) repeat protein
VFSNKPDQARETLRPNDVIDIDAYSTVSTPTLALTFFFDMLSLKFSKFFLTSTLLFALVLTLTWVLSLRPLRLKIGNHYFEQGNFDQAVGWYEKVVRKEKIAIVRLKGDSLQFKEDLGKLTSALRQQGDYFFRQGNFDRAADRYERLLEEQRLNAVNDRTSSPQYNEDLSKLNSALFPKMEKSILDVSRLLTLGDYTDFKSMLADPMFFQKDINRLTGKEGKMKLENAKERLVHFDNAVNYIRNLWGKSDIKELDALVQTSLFLKAILDEAENNYISADSKHQTAAQFSSFFSTHINARRKRILQKVGDEYLFRQPLSWAKAKGYYEGHLKDDPNDIDVLLKLAYICAKFNNFNDSYKYFMKAYELLKPIQIRKTVDHFRTKGTFLYPDDLEAIPQELTKHFSFLKDVSFFEVKSLLGVLDFKVIAKSNGFIGRTGTRSPVDIIIRSAGFPVGDYGHILIAGENVSQNKIGYNIVVANPETGQVEISENFNTYQLKADVKRMNDFIISIPKEKIVCVAVAHEASLALSKEEGNIFERIGAKDTLYGKFLWSHGIIGIKGARKGEALEKIGEKPIELDVIRSL